MTGAYPHSLDSAGRLIVPSKLRDKLGKDFYLAVGTRGNLTLYPMDEWNKLKAKVAEMTMMERSEMDVFFAAAQLCETDKQWRFQVPALLKEYAGIDRDVVITGNSTLAQIWNAQAWQEIKKQEINPANIAALMGRLRV